jgi:aspartyl-tRNA(Asn)/glutamyl-tRNA(Gln) amidotransferase subunit A
MNAELAWQPARRIGELVRSGELAAPEVVEYFLARISTYEPTVHAFVTIAAEQARAVAARLGRPPTVGGTWAGVPFSVKDNIMTAGIRTTLGSLLFENHMPGSDASVVSHLTTAGAVMLGKTNLPEFSMWGRSVNRVAAETQNPWDPTRTAGASSGGAAAGVAAGFVPLAVGSDDGGSIRLPAALNGVFGFLPSPGLVPMDATVVIAAVSAVGPITRDVRDAALFMDLMAGDTRVEAPLDGALDGPRDGGLDAGLDAGVAGLRVAWVHDHVNLPIMDERVVSTARAAAFALADAGAQVDEPGEVLVDSYQVATAPPDGSRYGGTHVHELSEFAAVAAADPEWRTRLSPYINADLVAGSLPQTQDPSGARRREQVVGQLTELLESYDLVVTPTIDQVAPPIPDGWEYPYGPAGCPPDQSRRAYTKYTLRVSLAGCPAASVPSGFVEGMPVGAQIIGRRGDDAIVLRASRALERYRPWDERHPFGE